MAEVLDHYHGPHSRKLWLLAWAEKVKRPDPARLAGSAAPGAPDRQSASRASHIAGELVGEGVIKRLGGGGRHRGKSTEYELLPLTGAQGSQVAARRNQRLISVRNQGSQGRIRASGCARFARVASGNASQPSDPQEPSSLSARGRDPRTCAEFASRAQTEREIEFIFAEIENDPGIRKSAAYLRTVSTTATAPASSTRCAAAAPPRTRTTIPGRRRRPPGRHGGRDPECDSQTRIRVTETEDGPRARKCPECHPDLAGSGREPRRAWRGARRRRPAGLDGLLLAGRAGCRARR